MQPTQLFEKKKRLFDVGTALVIFFCCKNRNWDQNLLQQAEVYDVRKNFVNEIRVNPPFNVVKMC